VGQEVVEAEHAELEEREVGAHAQVHQGDVQLQKGRERSTQTRSQNEAWAYKMHTCAYTYTT